MKAEAATGQADLDPTMMAAVTTEIVALTLP